MLALTTRWKNYFVSGKFKLSVDRDLAIGAHSVAEYWTSPYAYWDLHLDDPVLFKDLKRSSLVIFKGDLKCVKRQIPFCDLLI